MEFRILLFIWEFILDVLELVSMSAHEKDIQILLLQRQLRIAERQQKRAPRLTRWEKIPLAALAQKLKETSDNAKELLEATIRIFKPATLRSLIYLIPLANYFCEANDESLKNWGQMLNQFSYMLSARSCKSSLLIRGFTLSICVF